MTYNGLDVYNATIKEIEDGIVFISLVDMPAVERDFVCFKKAEEPLRFKIENEEKRIITGVVMTANSPILRVNGDYQYYITYSPETLQKMAEKMLYEGTFKNIDLMHNNKRVEGVNLLEVYQKDDSKGISPNFVEDVPDGSLMASFHVVNDALWDEIKNGDFLKGFSLEGFFTVEKMRKADYNNELNKNKKMSKITKFIKSLMKFGEITTDKGNLYFGEDEIAVGIEVFVNGENEEEKVVAEDGEYALEDGRIIVVKDGKVDEIREKEAEEPVEETPAEPEVEAEEVVEEPVVEEPAAPETDVNEERIANLEIKVADLEKQIADLVERLTKIETTPAVEPIVEEFEKVSEVETKGLPKSAQKSVNLFKNFKKK